MSWFPSIPVPGWIQRQRISSASQSGDLETVKQLIDSTNVNLPDAWGNAPLHNAAWNGHDSIVQFILEKKELVADVNLRDSENHTPLLLAAASGGKPETEGHKKTVQLLIDHEADLAAVDDIEYTCLMLAVVNGNQGIARIILEHLSNLSATEKSALINRQNQYQFTALHAACEQKSKELIELLLEFGANPELKDALGRTPTQVAKEAGLVLNLVSDTN